MVKKLQWIKENTKGDESGEEKGMGENINHHMG